MAEELAMPIPIISEYAQPRKESSRVFLVDVDGTLIPEFKGMEPKCPLRKGAHSFLKKLASMGKVYLCTLATRDYAKHVAKTHQFDHYLTGIIAREELSRMSSQTLPHADPVFIDNCENAIPMKARCLGILNVTGAYVVPTCDDNAQDDALVSILQEIQ